VHLLRLWGWLIIRKHKRQTLQSQVRDEHLESSKRMFLFAFAFLIYQNMLYLKRLGSEKIFDQLIKSTEREK